MKSLTEKGAAAEDGRVHVGEFSQAATISVSTLLPFNYVSDYITVTHNYCDVRNLILYFLLYPLTAVSVMNIGNIRKCD